MAQLTDPEILVCAVRAEMQTAREKKDVLLFHACRVYVAWLTRHRKTDDYEEECLAALDKAQKSNHLNKYRNGARMFKLRLLQPIFWDRYRAILSNPPQNKDKEETYLKHRAAMREVLLSCT